MLALFVSGNIIPYHMDLSTIANLKIAKGAVIGRDRMVVGCTYHCEFEPRSGKVYLIQHYVIKFVAGRWFCSGTPVSSTNNTDCHDIPEILLKVALNTIKPK